MEAICPCCGQPLHTFTQSYPAKYNRPDRIYVTCENPTCHTVGRTLSPEEHRQLCARNAASENVVSFGKGISINNQG